MFGPIFSATEKSIKVVFEITALPVALSTKGLMVHCSPVRIKFFAGVGRPGEEVAPVIFLC